MRKENNNPGVVFYFYEQPKDSIQQADSIPKIYSQSETRNKRRSLKIKN